MNKAQWLEMNHEWRLTRRLSQQHSTRKRAIKNAHKAWLCRKALAKVIPYQRQGLDQAIRMAAILG